MKVFKSVWAKEGCSACGGDGRGLLHHRAVLRRLHLEDTYLIWNPKVATTTLLYHNEIV